MKTTQAPCLTISPSLLAQVGMSAAIESGRVRADIGVGEGGRNSNDPERI
jgi:hypothetical protein